MPDILLHSSNRLGDDLGDHHDTVGSCAARVRQALMDNLLRPREIQPRFLISGSLILTRGQVLVS